MSAWWHGLTVGQQYVLAVVVLGSGLTYVACRVVQWIAGGLDSLDLLLWEAELKAEPADGGAP